ncbi:MAG: trypsin-like peptidase domain-containing protein [Nanoarchaeota archaeon]
MALQRHHKILIGSFTSIIIIFMITSSVMLYFIFVKQTTDFNNLNKKITELQTETNTKINDISESLLQTNQLISSEVGSLTQQLTLLKASVGEDFSGIIDYSIPAVVTIKTDYGQGTGFIIDEEGYVVTNAHVLADNQGYLATSIIAITSERETKNAQFVGFDSTLDIAVLKIQGTYEKLELGNSNDVQIGEKVITIGNPLGLQFSVTQGIVSAVHRQGGNGLNAYIQIDAALNPGNSGGPLIDTDGKVIGINNFKIGGGENLGFALESNYIKQAVNEIAQKNLNQTLIN